MQSDKQTISFDPQAYLHHLDDSELTEAQKEELLAALWGIMATFVSLGFGIHPVQQVRDASDDPGEARARLDQSAKAAFTTETEKERQHEDA